MSARTGLSLLLLLIATATVVSGAAARHGGGHGSWRYGGSPGRTWHNSGSGRLWQGRRLQGINDFKFGLSAAVGDYSDDAVSANTAAAAAATPAGQTAATDTVGTAPGDSVPTDAAAAKSQVGFQPPLTLSKPVSSDSAAQQSDTVINTVTNEQQPQSSAEGVQAQGGTMDLSENVVPAQDSAAQQDQDSATSVEQVAVPAIDAAGSKASPPVTTPTSSTSSRKLHRSGSWGNGYGGSGWRGWYGGNGRSWQGADSNDRIWQGRRLQGAQVTDSTAESAATESAKRYGMGSGGHAWGGGGSGMIWHGRRLQGTKASESVQHGGGGNYGPGSDWNFGDINDRSWQWGPNFGDRWGNSWGGRKLMSSEDAESAQHGGGGSYGPGSDWNFGGGINDRSWQSGPGFGGRWGDWDWNGRKLMGAKASESVQHGGGGNYGPGSDWNFGDINDRSWQWGPSFGDRWGNSWGGRKLMSAQAADAAESGGHYGPGSAFWPAGAGANVRSWQQGYGPGWANRKLLGASSTSTAAASESAQRGGGGGGGGHFGPGADFNWGGVNDRSWQQGYGPSWAN